MKCPRCNIFRVEEEGSELCVTCNIAINVLQKPDEVTDKEILSSSAIQKLIEGCKECGDNDFGYSGGTLVEGELKWYILQVICGNCGVEYDEVLEVRTINGTNKHTKKK